MNTESGIRMGGTAVLVGSALLVGAGALATYLVMQRPGPDRQDPPVMSSPMSLSAPRQPEPGATRHDTASDLPAADVSVTLSEEAVARAGIEVTAVQTSADGGAVRIPGTVEPNAYRTVTVTPIAAGRVTRVNAELGQQVRQGQPLAEIYSPDLAEAQMRHVSARAELEAHEQALRRTERLVEIGAASRQELEKIHAEHTAAVTTVESSRSRLSLLGMTDARITELSSSLRISANTTIPAPMAGVITTREANVGLNVSPETPLFTVVDLATVWIVGDLYERDFGRVRVGSAALVTTSAYPDVSIEGTVSYIDPQVRADTRTARVRVEVPNRGGALRLGMYAEVQVAGSGGAPTPAIPRSAVQMLGNRSVVYLADADQRGRFLEREVQLGDTRGDQVAVLAGLRTGDLVVTRGSFSIRAERDRLGLRAPATGSRQP